MIVVDANVLASLYLPTDYTAGAEALFERDSDWVAPVLWRSEFRNILAGYMRRRTLSFDQARDVQSEAESLLSGSEYEVESRQVLELVHDSDCSAYDCEYVALARELGIPVVTADRQLLRAFPAFAVSPKDFVGVK